MLQNIRGTEKIQKIETRIQKYKNIKKKMQIQIQNYTGGQKTFYVVHTMVV